MFAHAITLSGEDHATIIIPSSPVAHPFLTFASFTTSIYLLTMMNFKVLPTDSLREQDVRCTVSTEKRTSRLSKRYSYGRAAMDTRGSTGGTGYGSDDPPSDRA